MKCLLIYSAMLPTDNCLNGLSFRVVVAKQMEEKGNLEKGQGMQEKGKSKKGSRE